MPEKPDSPANALAGRSNFHDARSRWKPARPRVMRGWNAFTPCIALRTVRWHPWTLRARARKTGSGRGIHSSQGRITVQNLPPVGYRQVVRQPNAEQS